MPALITGSEFATYLGLNETAEGATRLAYFADGASEFVNNYTGRDWQSAARTNEKYRGNDTKFLTLRHYPVTALTALSRRGACRG